MGRVTALYNEAMSHWRIVSAMKIYYAWCAQFHISIRIPMDAGCCPAGRCVKQIVQSSYWLNATNFVVSLLR